MAARGRIIPCLDLREGRVVKGVNFQGLRDLGDPVELAKAYQYQGADELVLLDISATTQGKKARFKIIETIAEELTIPFTVGGGIRQLQDARQTFEAGASKISIATAAVTHPQLINQLAEEFGPDKLVIAVDARRIRAEAMGDEKPRWEVLIAGGTKQTGLQVYDWLKEIEARGAAEVLLTSWDRDGTRQGFDLELLKRASGATTLPIIASGGAANARHLALAFQAGADAVLAASIFHEGDYTVDAIKDELAKIRLDERK